jgi:nitroreductase
VTTTDLHTGLTPLLRDRWSPRVLDDTHELSDEELLLLLEAARWAPSTGNSQPWSYLVGRRGDETFSRLLPTLSRGNSRWVPRASAILVSLRQVAPAPGEEPGTYAYAAHDTGQAAAHLTVQAASMGLVVHQFAGFDHDAVAAEFGVPGHVAVTAGIAVGRLGDPRTTDVHEKDRSARTRRPLTDFVYAGRWGETAPVVR